jgi:hypothetical protein
VVGEPNGPSRGIGAKLSNAPSHPTGNAAFIHTFILMAYTSLWIRLSLEGLSRGVGSVAVDIDWFPPTRKKKLHAQYLVTAKLSGYQNAY